ncbi:ComEC family competence protein [Chitinophagaceae bacterium LB-8]|uniref:ComEC family competence protein n=1 Tax=Paraflavisolibacter caeni TaxID=2982496 RepID=A0A9X2Y204_9BACT|nr:ComEC/Rec2 family competence protein [Paraflavisolibacter caeni]MCU7552063.1 ComEC family competence protein [Paraflavisolibacter caeni]
MAATKTYWWTQAPFMRLVISLVIGIVVQWYFQVSFEALLYAGLFLTVVVLSYSFLPLTQKFRFATLNGLCFSLLVGVLGAFLTRNEDIRNESLWYGHQLDGNTVLVVSLEEPLVEKPATYKSTGLVQYIKNKRGQLQQAEGKVLLYFKKDVAQKLSYGSMVAIYKPLQDVRNSGNPGTFDYRRYCLFQGITHQVYLTAQDFTILESRNENVLQVFLIRSRLFFIDIIKKYIVGAKEAGLAEALLIGYKEDLDKILVQAYSNTGVVHVIAISGLHLGLIYLLLLGLTKPLQRFKVLKFIRFLVIVSMLWLFTLLAGAQPSVLRSAVMFSCIALGEVIARRASIYNTLALSAFLLLCVNPFWLWDVGFQLSYAAVLSIVIFFQPIYNWFHFSNKLVEWVWKMVAVTLSAQILTSPISLFHFHQFPVLFILTNLVAVPLSSAILIGELALCALAFVSPVAAVLGTALTYCIRFMNDYIEGYDGVSFTVWNGISISILQTILLFLFIACVGYWLLEQRNRALLFGLVCLVALFLLRTLSFIEAGHQRKVIVYNTPRYQAIDFIEGRNFYYAGDAVLLEDELLYNFHLKPSRVLNRVKTVKEIPQSQKGFDFNGKKIAIIDNSFFIQQGQPKSEVDVIVLSRNPQIYIKDICKGLSVKQIVIDGSVPAWKAKLWKRDCDSLHLPCYDVAEKGAFVMNLR